MLDKDYHWQEELNEDQLARLAFVRLLIHDPAWVLIDEVLDFVDVDSRAMVTDVLSKRMKDSAIVHIGRQLAHDVVYDAAQAAAVEGKSFGDLLAADKRVTAHLDAKAIAALLDPTAYTGLCADMAREAAARARREAAAIATQTPA